MFHSNLVHGSSRNITPYPRRIVYLTLSAVSNAIRKPTRPEFIAHRNFTRLRRARPMRCVSTHSDVPLRFDRLAGHRSLRQPLADLHVER